jgi:hypothetical protein
MCFVGLRANWTSVRKPKEGEVAAYILSFLTRSFHRRNAQPADPIRIFKNWPFRYWTQTSLG